MTEFIWDPAKEKQNILKHGVDFTVAAQAFKDLRRKIFVDEKHTQAEERYFCLGKIKGRVLTVRFLYRDNQIRIIGAGYWRKGRNIMIKRASNIVDMPIGELKQIKDFLPPPDQLTSPEETVKVTISLTKKSLGFFKREAARNKIKYQKMIRAVVDRYAKAYEH